MKLLFIVEASPIPADTLAFIKHMEALKNLGAEAAIFTPGEERREDLAAKAPSNVTIHPFDRLWLNMASDIVASSQASHVAIVNDIKTNLEPICKALQDQSGSKEDVILTWPEYHDLSAQSPTALDLFFWLYQIPQAPPHHFIFSRHCVNEQGGFNPIYPLVSHWELMIKLSQTAGMIKTVPVKTEETKNAPYAPGADCHERLRYIMQGALMVQENGENTIGAVTHFMLQYNLAEQIGDEGKPLFFWIGESTRQILLWSFEYTYTSIKHVSPWLNRNGLEPNSNMLLSPVPFLRLVKRSLKPIYFALRLKILGRI